MVRSGETARLVSHKRPLFAWLLDQLCTPVLLNSFTTVPKDNIQSSRNVHLFRHDAFQQPLDFSELAALFRRVLAPHSWGLVLLLSSLTPEALLLVRRRIVTSTPPLSCRSSAALNSSSA